MRETNEFQNEFSVNNLDMFEENVEKNCGDTMVQNILDTKQIIDDKFKSITITLGESSRPYGLFRDKHYEEYNFPTLFFGHPRPSFECSYQKIYKLNYEVSIGNSHTI